MLDAGTSSSLTFIATLVYAAISVSEEADVMPTIKN